MPADLPRDPGSPDSVAAPTQVETEVLFDLRRVNVYASGERVLADITIEIEAGETTAVLGAPASGKTSLLRALNRLHDHEPEIVVTGRVIFRGIDLYGPRADPIEIRRRIGMVLTRPHLFPGSIRANVEFGLRNHGLGEVASRARQALGRVGLWDGLEGRLEESPTGLDAADQQRLCIARTLAVEPEVILLDEPCDALETEGSRRIEELLLDLRDDHTLVLATADPAMAARIAATTVFISDQPDASGRGGSGRVVESGPTSSLFTNPGDRLTEEYIGGS